MTETKTCTMCGEEKPIDDFRTQQRRNHTKGEYRRPYCKDCEAIEVRRQYLLGIINLTPEHQEELNQINELYRLRMEKGLNTFGARKCRRGATVNLVNEQLTKLKEAECKES